MVDFDVNLPDSGARQEFETGAVRDIQKGKGRFDLISHVGTRRLACRYEGGALKYGDNNWQKGIPVSRCLDSALRHLNEYKAGDQSEDHLAAAAWNIFTMMHMEEYNPDMCDLLFQQPRKTKQQLFSDDGLIMELEVDT